MRRLADEDVTHLGEQLQRLDREVAGQVLDEEARVAYQTALDAYESAKRTVPRITRAEEISKITDTLSTGRYALACVQARVAGRPVPEQRVPCFFNPQHGPSVTEVLWTRPGHGTRRVPACSQDAERVAHHQVPEVRTVRIDSRSVPYWTAGRAFLPYTEGYFGGAAALAWAFHPPVVGGVAGTGTAGHFGAGHHGVGAGGFDGSQGVTEGGS